MRCVLIRLLSGRQINRDMLLPLPASLKSTPVDLSIERSYHWCDVNPCFFFDNIEAQRRRQNTTHPVCPFETRLLSKSPIVSKVRDTGGAIVSGHDIGSSRPAVSTAI